MNYKRNLTPQQALQKLKQYCGYQERCHQEVKEKLYALGIRSRDQDELISTLIEQDYLNEERFAVTFAGGKFRIKNWGRIKIRYELKQRDISDYCIKKALKEIDEEEYLKVLNKLVESRWESCSDLATFEKRKWVTDNLISRGFERDLIIDRLRKY